MKNLLVKVFVLFSIIASFLLADGLLMSEDLSYPNDFLRNKITEVNVNIKGLIAETVVYQEFVNEWDQAVDAVYSFPLPENARSTKLKYALDDEVYVAVLKVQQQSTNPGTGSGGVAALVNAYIGSNGLKLALKNIPAGGIQKIELSYISLLEYHQGECRYEYPLATDDFVSHAIDHLEFNFNIESSELISDYSIPTHSGYQLMLDEPNHIQLRLRKPKAYLTTDLVFKYFVDDNDLDVDLYSTANDSMDGHFTLFVRPENHIDSADVLEKNIVFLLGNSSRMVGYQLDQSIASISRAIDSLSSNDYFNIILFNSNTASWKSNLVPATSENIASAKVYLNAVEGRYGSRMDLGINKALQQFQSDEYSNSIIAFTDGYFTLDPKLISENNIHKIGIFPIGIGPAIDRSRLEMTAALNYGFVTYFDETDNLKEGMDKVFEKINKPLLKNTELEFNKADISRLIPQQYPTTFAGTCFFVAGRYQTPGSTEINLSGIGVNDTLAYVYQVDFTDNSQGYKAPEYIWAKEMIDAIEREIAIYGEAEALKDSVIELSLRYNIRCRYTAYVADYSTTDDGYTDVLDVDLLIPESHILNSYPNPFNPVTTIRFYLDPSVVSKVKFLKVYNVMGQLVNVIDVSHLASGWHDIIFNGCDFFGQALESGIYFVSLIVDSEISNTIKITLQK